jgi:alpha-glucosidase (family GH31 glycosyl hydrolase)
LTDELYIRWLQYSTFTPLQEFFGAKAPGIGARWPWLFGTTVTQLPAIAKLYNQLRYRLLPFRYSNAQAAYHDEHPADPLTLDVYPGGATSYTLYEDDGMSDGYLGGAFAPQPSAPRRRVGTTTPWPRRSG